MSWPPDNVQVLRGVLQTPVGLSGKIEEIRKGDPGPQGPTGPGVPSGGTVGQVLVKKSATDYDTEWSTDSGPVLSVNSKTGAVTLTASDVGALPDTTVIPSKVSDLQNDSGFITGYTETDPTVPSWAKASSKPTYTKSEVGLGNVDNVQQYSASNPPPYPVTSVNGSTGAVTVSVPAASSATPQALGTASAGSSSDYSRADHVHAKPTYSASDVGAQTQIVAGSVTMASANWTGSGPYTQTVTVTGATVTSSSKVDIQPDTTAINQLVTDGVTALYIVNNAGTLTATAIGAAPTANLTVQVTVTEVS